MSVHSRDVFLGRSAIPGTSSGEKTASSMIGRQREMTLEPFANLGQTPLDLGLAVASQQSQENGRRSTISVSGRKHSRMIWPKKTQVCRQASPLPGVSGGLCRRTNRMLQG